MKSAQSFIQALSHWAVSNPDFPESSRQQARLCFIDTIACMMSGANSPQSKKAYSAMTGTGAMGSVQSVCGEHGFPTSAAALVNGVAAHALDFDDYESRASTHPSASIVPALLALGELHNASIGEMLESYLVGYETIIRIGEALSYEHYLNGWHATSTVGPVGASAACARLLKLDSDQFANALSLAMSMSSGLKDQFGSDAKAIHAGLSARAGIDASIMADSGITANQRLMESDYGYLKVYGTASSPGTNYAQGKIGKQCAMEEYPVLRKPWPSCAYTHRIIEAAMNILQNSEIDFENIISGEISVPAPYARVAGFSNPVDVNQARFSISYCAASTLTDGQFEIASLTSEALQRPETRALEKKLIVNAYDSGTGFEDMSPDTPDTIVLTLLNGQEISETVGNVKGGRANPMTVDEIRQKFHDANGPPELADIILHGKDSDLIRLSDFP